MERIKELRQALGIRQVDMASDFGISQSTLSTWEGGRYEPDLATVTKLADYFGVSIDYLVGRTSNPKTANEIADRLGILDKERTHEEERVYMALQNDDKFRETMMRIYSLPEDVRASFAEFANALIELDRNAKKNK